MKKCSWLVAVLVGALTTILPGAAMAQVANVGTIEVIVEDADGGRLPGVTVTATAPDTVTKRTAVSDGQGVATLDALAPSTQYTIVSELSGFQNQTVNKVLVRSGADGYPARHPGHCRSHRGGDRDGRHAPRGRQERDDGPGHHPRSSPSRCRPAAATRATCSSSPACCRTTRPAAATPPRGRV